MILESSLSISTPSTIIQHPYYHYCALPDEVLLEIFQFLSYHDLITRVRRVSRHFRSLSSFCFTSISPRYYQHQGKKLDNEFLKLLPTIIRTGYFADNSLSFRFEECDVTSMGFVHLRALSNIRSLHFKHCYLRQEGIESLLTLTNLEELGLRTCVVDMDLTLRLITSLPRLRVLTTNFVQMCSLDRFEALPRAKNLYPRIRLEIPESERIGYRDYTILGTSTSYSTAPQQQQYANNCLNFEYISFYGGFKDSDLDTFVMMLQNLTSVELFFCNDITDDGMQLLVSRLPRLKRVIISACNKIHDKYGIWHLTNAPRLTELFLGRRNVTSKTIRVINSNITHLSLEYLRNDLDATVIDTLAFHLTNLRSLRIRTRCSSCAGHALLNLARRMPQLTIKLAT
eukprot:GEZU01009609.1.p1 GENE.GEZU01009609.1~~GEZU01009609.1.p1  ORF type:complete len:399 (-),score=51.35 GEZU01009609.1:167-1363(-)